MYELVMPSSGMAMTEGAIVEWRVKVGDRVAVGQVIAEIETDKTNVEVESEVAGLVAELVRGAGEVVAVGDPIARIETDEDE